MENSLKDLAVFIQTNKKLFLLGSVFSIFAVYVIILFIVVIPKQNNEKNKVTEKVVLPTPNVGPTSEVSGEKITSINYDINCKVYAATNTQKIILRQTTKCSEKLSYVIASSGQFAVYLIPSAGVKYSLVTYSLANKIDSVLAELDSKPQDLVFDPQDDLVLLTLPDSDKKQKLVVYFLPLLFKEYPGNYDQTLSIFTNLPTKTVEVDLSASVKSFKNILAKSSEIDLLDDKGGIAYIVPRSGLVAKLTPTKIGDIDRNSLNWSKRIAVFDGKVLKTTDFAGKNEITHKLICREKEMVPLEYYRDLTSRSPDGRLLVFLIPPVFSENDVPDWKAQVNARKKPFKEGDLVLYDLIKDKCQELQLRTSIAGDETFSISPNGLYLAYVNRGVKLYNLQTKTDYQLTDHNRDNSRDPSVVSGPLVWDSASKFILNSVTHLSGGSSTTQLVRTYFGEDFRGGEQTLVDLLTQSTLYTISPDGGRAVYKKDNNLYIYDAATGASSFLKSVNPDEVLTKIVWLRDGSIVSDSWYTDQNSIFITLPKKMYFTINFAGDSLVYRSYGAGAISLYSFTSLNITAVPITVTPENAIFKLFY